MDIFNEVWRLEKYILFTHQFVKILIIKDTTAKWPTYYAFKVHTNRKKAMRHSILAFQNSVLQTTFLCTQTVTAVARCPCKKEALAKCFANTRKKRTQGIKQQRIYAKNIRFLPSLRPPPLSLFLHRTQRAAARNRKIAIKKPGRGARVQLYHRTRELLLPALPLYNAVRESCSRDQRTLMLYNGASSLSRYSSPRASPPLKGHEGEWKKNTRRRQADRPFVNARDARHAR